MFERVRIPRFKSEFSGKKFDLCKKNKKKTVLIQNFKIKVKFQLEKNLNSEIIVNYAKAIKIEFCE